MAIRPHKNRKYTLYLWEWRKARGLTGPELSKRTGIDQGTISVLESGSRRPNLDHLLAIAQALDLNASQLFRSPEDPLSELEKVFSSLPEATQVQIVKVLKVLVETNDDRSS